MMREEGGNRTHRAAPATNRVTDWQWSRDASPDVPTVRARTGRQRRRGWLTERDGSSRRAPKTTRTPGVTLLAANRGPTPVAPPAMAAAARLSERRGDGDHAVLILRLRG